MRSGTELSQFLTSFPTYSYHRMDTNHVDATAGQRSKS